MKHPLFIPFLLVLTVDGVCYISYKCQPPNNLAEHQYFYTKDFISLLHFEKQLALSTAKVFRNIHFLPLFPYFWKWMRFVIFQVNVDFLINLLTKYFYTRHLTIRLYFKWTFALSIAESFRNIHFLPHFY